MFHFSLLGHMVVIRDQTRSSDSSESSASWESSAPRESSASDQVLLCAICKIQCKVLELKKPLSPTHTLSRSLYLNSLTLSNSLTVSLSLSTLGHLTGSANCLSAKCRGTVLHFIFLYVGLSFSPRMCLQLIPASHVPTFFNFLRPFINFPLSLFPTHSQLY